MSRRGFRKITIEGEVFRWRFDDRLVVLPENRSVPQLHVDWNWRDWMEQEGPGPEPQIVTPSFVAKAIRFALSHGWQPHNPAAKMLLNLRETSFVLEIESHSSQAHKTGED